MNKRQTYALVFLFLAGTYSKAEDSISLYESDSGGKWCTYCVGRSVWNRQPDWDPSKQLPMTLEALINKSKKEIGAVGKSCSVTGIELAHVPEFLNVGQNKWYFRVTLLGKDQKAYDVLTLFDGTIIKPIKSEKQKLRSSLPGLDGIRKGTTNVK